MSPEFRDEVENEAQTTTEWTSRVRPRPTNRMVRSHVAYLDSLMAFLLGILVGMLIMALIHL